MRIFAQNRGGLAVFGGLYDPHTDEAVVRTRDGETVALTIEYPDTPTSPSKAESGITASEPSVSGSKVTTTLTALQDGGYIDFTATVGGQVRKVRVRARSGSSVDRYDG